MTRPQATSQARAALAPTGPLRAVVNLGNPVLAQGDQDGPRGVAVDLAALLAARLGVPLALTCVTAARDAVTAIESGTVDVGFVAVDPDRAQTLAFTDPYVVIEALLVVPEASPFRCAADVDAPGVRIGVKRGSAYDLHLSRGLSQATVVRGDEGVDVYLTEGLDAGAGIRGPVVEFVGGHDGQRAAIAGPLRAGPGRGGLSRLNRSTGPPLSGALEPIQGDPPLHGVVDEARGIAVVVPAHGIPRRVRLGAGQVTQLRDPAPDIVTVRVETLALRHRVEDPHEG